MRSDYFRGCGCLEEMIVPAAQNLDVGDDRGANVRIGDGMSAFDYSWTAGREVGKSVGVEQVNLGVGRWASARGIDVRPQMCERVVVRQGSCLIEQHGPTFLSMEPFIEGGFVKTPCTVDSATKDLSLIHLAFHRILRKPQVSRGFFESEHFAH